LVVIGKFGFNSWFDFGSGDTGIVGFRLQVAPWISLNGSIGFMPAFGLVLSAIGNVGFTAAFGRYFAAPLLISVSSGQAARG
jgi:hypothetical protein